MAANPMHQFNVFRIGPEIRLGEVDISLESGQDEIQELSVQQDSTGTYSLEYLNPIIKAVGSSVDTVTCEYSSAKPLRVELKVSNLGQIHFYLAPRVES